MKGAGREAVVDHATVMGVGPEGRTRLQELDQFLGGLLGEAVPTLLEEIVSLWKRCRV